MVTIIEFLDNPALNWKPRDWKKNIIFIINIILIELCNVEVNSVIYMISVLYINIHIYIIKTHNIIIWNHSIQRPFDWSNKKLPRICLLHGAGFHVVLDRDRWRSRKVTDNCKGQHNVYRTSYSLNRIPYVKVLNNH